MFGSILQWKHLGSEGYFLGGGVKKIQFLSAIQMLKLLLIWWIIVGCVLWEFSPLHLRCHVCACRFACCVASILLGSAGSMVTLCFIPDVVGYWCLLLFFFISLSTDLLISWIFYPQENTFISPSFFFLLFYILYDFSPICVWFICSSFPLF